MGEPVCENCYEKTKGRGETTELKKEGCDKCGGDTTITHRKIGNCTVLMNEFCTDCGYNWTRKR